MSPSQRKETNRNEILLDDIIIERVGETLSKEAEQTNENVIFLENGDSSNAKPISPSVPSDEKSANGTLDLVSLSAEIDSFNEVVKSTHENEKIDISLEDEILLDEIPSDVSIDENIGGEISHIAEETFESNGEIVLDDQLQKDESILEKEFTNEGAMNETEAPSSDALADSKISPKSSLRMRFVEEVESDDSLEKSEDVRLTTSENLENVNSSLEIDSPHVDFNQQTAQVSQPSSKKESHISITLPEDVSESLAKDFDIHSLDPIDLKEAEKIANEDILILTEEDLIEELDAMDLIPLEEENTIKENKEVHQKTSGEVQRRILDDEMTVLKQPKNIKKKEVEVEEVESIEVEPEEAEPLKVEPIEDIILAKEVDERHPVDEENPQKAEEIIEPIILEIDEDELLDSEKDALIKKASEEIVDDLVFGDDHSIDRDRQIYKEDARNIEEEAITLELESSEQGDEILTETLKKSESQFYDKGELSGEESEEGSVMPVEEITAELANFPEQGYAFIIDDIMVKKEAKETRDEEIFIDSELEKSAIGVIDIGEGAARFIPEASMEEDKEQIAAIMSGTAMAFEDLLVDFLEEYKFKDEDISFIDEVFVADVVKDADIFISGKIREKNKLSPAMEIFGLSDDEIQQIESAVFLAEYKDIDLSKIAKSKIGLDQAPSDFGILKNCQYIGSSVSEITLTEKESIEKDVVMNDAVVFEEGIEDIRRVLLNYRRTKKRPADDIIDITDEIVIIDDSRDVQRFIDTFEPEKRENLKKLLKYLDGLFEWLPEEVIRQFANSEYYNLYVKIMNELE